jgi:hypothetical protein
MELMSRICEFNRQADLGAWDSLKMNMLRTHLELEHGLGEVHGVTLSKIDPAQATEGWNMMAQPTEENDSMPCVRPPPPASQRISESYQLDGWICNTPAGISIPDGCRRTAAAGTAPLYPAKWQRSGACEHNNFVRFSKRNAGFTKTRSG